MNLYGIKIFCDELYLKKDCKEKIRRIAESAKAISTATDMSIRLVKDGASYEGLLWGKIKGVPIGAYNRGPTMSLVLDTLARRVKKECLKALDSKAHKHHLESPPSIVRNHQPSNMPLAG